MKSIKKFVSILISLALLGGCSSPSTAPSQVQSSIPQDSSSASGENKPSSSQAPTSQTQSSVPALVEEKLPEGLEELPIAVGSGKYLLEGVLTRREGKQGKYAVVLVHGSGPQDMDETIYENKPFRDISHGLAKQGIDVLRYNKSTFSHPQELMEEFGNEKLTVKEETIDDAVIAGKILDEMDYEKVFLAGHSLGGMLAPRIYEASGRLFDGLIILAGSTRNLTDIVIDQNNDLIATLPDGQKDGANAIVDAEKKKLDELMKMSDQEAGKQVVFGMPGYYIKELNSHDTAKIAAGIDRPFLVLQGSADFQVSAEKDFPLWKTALAGNSKAQFILYEGLGHLFTKAPVPATNSVRDYAVPLTVEQKVIDDIAAFIKS